VSARENETIRPCRSRPKKSATATAATPTPPRSSSSRSAALESNPESAALWCLRGDLVQTVAGRDADELAHDEARTAYEQALAFDPESLHANHELGVLLDLVDDDPEGAEPLLRAAVALGGGEPSALALARVLAQLGEEQQALVVLEEAPDPTSDRVCELRDEILAGDWSPDGD
jgi:hypothetical protein